MDYSLEDLLESRSFESAYDLMQQVNHPALSYLHGDSVQNRSDITTAILADMKENLCRTVNQFKIIILLNGLLTSILWVYFIFTLWETYVDGLNNVIGFLAVAPALLTSAILWFAFRKMITLKNVTCID